MGPRIVGRDVDCLLVVALGLVEFLRLCGGVACGNKIVGSLLMASGECKCDRGEDERAGCDRPCGSVHEVPLGLEEWLSTLLIKSYLFQKMSLSEVALMCRNIRTLF